MTLGVDRGAATVLPEQADKARQAPRTTSRRMRRTLSTPRRQVRPSLVIGGDDDAGRKQRQRPKSHGCGAGVDLRFLVTEWILTRAADPYQGVRREAGFDNLWFGAVPRSGHGDGLQ